VFEAVSSTATEIQITGANQNANTASQVIEIIKKQGDPPGSHAASILLEAVMDNGEVFSPGGAGGDILGVVGLLASVDDDLLNRYKTSTNLHLVLRLTSDDNFLNEYFLYISLCRFHIWKDIP
jgi:hypothetical protein